MAKKLKTVSPPEVEGAKTGENKAKPAKLKTVSPPYPQPKKKGKYGWLSREA